MNLSESDQDNSLTLTPHILSVTVQSHGLRLVESTSDGSKVEMGVLELT